MSLHAELTLLGHLLTQSVSLFTFFLHRNFIFQWHASLNLLCSAFIALLWPDLSYTAMCFQRALVLPANALKTKVNLKEFRNIVSLY